MNSKFWNRIPSTLLFLFLLCLQINHSKGIAKKSGRNRMAPKMRQRPNQFKNTYYPQLQNPSMVELHKVQNSFLREIRKIQPKERGNSFWQPTRSLLEHGMGTERDCENRGFTRQCGQRLNEDVDKIDNLGMRIINRNPLVRTKFIKIRKMQMRMKRRKRSPVAESRKADDCHRMEIRMKNKVSQPGTVLRRVAFRIIGKSNKNKTQDFDLTAKYFAFRCTKLLRANSKEMMPAKSPMIKAYRRRRKREIIFEGENSFYELNPQIRSKRENTNQDAVGPPISKMRFTTHSLPPENYYYDSRQDDPMARQRSQSVTGQMDGGGDGGDAEVEHESSHDHKYANDVNPDGSTKVNLHTTGMDKFKYSGDGMPPAYGISSYGHRYSGMPPSSSMRYPGHSTRNNMKVRFDDPRYGVSMNAQHKFNARHTMPMMPRQAHRQTRPPMVMRRPAIPSKMRMSRGPIYHGGYHGTYHGGPGYSGNSHSDYHHQIGPRYQHSFHNSHNVNHGGRYYDYYDDGDSDEDDSSDEDSDDEDDDFDGMAHNYRMKHGTYYSHSNGPGYHRSHFRVQHNIQMGGNPFMDSPRKQHYYPPPKKRSGSFVGKLVATIFVILFLMIIIL